MLANVQISKVVHINYLFNAALSLGGTGQRAIVSFPDHSNTHSWRKCPDFVSIERLLVLDAAKPSSGIHEKQRHRPACTSTQSVQRL